MNDLKGSSADDVFTAEPGVSAITGNPTTTINAGDKIEGGTGEDTLNITATASNNNSLTGLTVSNVEVVNITGGNNIGGNSGTIADALVAQTAAEAALVSKAAIDAVLVAEDNAATAVDDLIVDVLASGAEADSVEDALGWLALSSPAAVVSAKAALDYLEENAFTDYAEIAGVLASGYTLPTGVTAFTLAEMKAAATATLSNADGSSNVNSDAGVDGRLDDLIDEINVTVNYAQASGSTEAAQDAQAAAYTALSESVEEADAAVTNAGLDVVALAASVTSVAQAAQLEDAYEAVLALADEDSSAALLAVEAALEATTSPSDSFTLDQYKAAAAAVEKTQAGAAITAVDGVTQTTELQTVTFTALEPGQSINVHGLRAYTTVALDATEVADLFVDVAADATGGVVTTGVTYSGAFGEGLDAEEAATGATMGFDGEAAATDVATMTTSAVGGATAPTVVETTKGVAAVTAVSVAEAVAVRASELDAAATDVNAEIGGGIAAATFSVANVEAAAVAATKNAVTGVALTTVAAIEARADALAIDHAAYADAVESAGVDSWTFAELKTAAANVKVSIAGASLITEANDSLTIEDRAEAIVTATGTALTAGESALATAAGTDITASNAYDVALAAATNGSVAASQFAGSEQVWLKGASNATNVTGISTQTIGLDSLSGLNSTLAFGAASGSIYSKGSSGSLTVTGAKALSISGTTGTLAITATSTSLAVDMSGSNSLTLTNAASLESIAISGDGKSTLTGVPATVETITSTSGAVSATISTVTVVDAVATDIDETVNATVTTGDGADTITVATTGTGKTTVSTGGGNDVLIIGARGLNARDTIDAGLGTDTMVFAGKSYTAQDYVVLDSAVSGVEVALFYSSVTADASKLGIPVLALESGGTLTEASSASIQTWGSLTASSTGYDLTDGVVDTVYGGNLAVTLTGGTSVLTTKKTGASSALTLNAEKATVTIAATSNGSITGTSIAGDLKELVVNLSNSKTTSGNSLAATTITVTATENEALTAVDLNGTGSVTINTSAAANEAIVLATIDASGLGGKTLYDTKTASSTVGSITGGLTFTGNTYIAETISLGSGTDNITVNSTYEKMDTISGADFVKETSNAKSTTDVIVFGGLTLDGSAENEITKLELTSGATSLNLAFVEAAASGTDTVFFAFDGDTYLFKDGGNGTLDDADLAVKIVGIIDLTTDWGVYSA